MGPISGRQDPGGPHVGPMNFAILILYVSNKLSLGFYHFAIIDTIGTSGLHCNNVFAENIIILSKYQTCMVIET